MCPVALQPPPPQQVSGTPTARSKRVMWKRRHSSDELLRRGNIRHLCQPECHHRREICRRYATPTVVEWSCHPLVCHCSLIMALFLFFLCLGPGAAQSVPCSSSPIVIKPTRQVIEDKSPLQLTCTILPKYRDKYKVKDLYFEKNNRVYNLSHPYIIVNSDYQITLAVPQAHYEDFKGLVRCWIPGLELCFQYLHNTTANVVFRRDPLEPEFKSCIVENWEHLHCTWIPSREEQLKHTLTTKTYHNFTYDFIYTKISNNKASPQQRCQCDTETAFCNKEHLLNETCVLDIESDLNSFEMGGLYSLNIHARTDRSDQEVKSWKQQFGSYFNTSEHVKPNPVENITYDNTTGVLAWKRPSSTWSDAEFWSLVYNVTYRTQWNKITTTLITSQDRVTLSVPYTEYHVNITVKPKDTGYWSDLSSISYKVPAMPPTVNPDTSALGYEYDPTCSSHCKVLIHWQPIKSDEQYGPHMQYLILRKNASHLRHRRQLDRDSNENRIAKTLQEQAVDDWTVAKFVNGFKNSFTDLTVTDDMEVTIVTKNAKGQNSISDNSIFVKRKDHALNVPEVLIIEGYREKPNGILVSFEHAPPKASNMSYVLFWQDKNKEDPVRWHPLPTENGTLKWNISLEKDYNAYRYGLGKAYEENNSGIQWSTKPVFTYEGLAEPPSDIQVTSLGANSVTLHWNIPVIQPGDGHVIYYSIQFCSWDNDTHLCTEDHIKSRRIPGTDISVTLNKLSHSTVYVINITSITRAGQSTKRHSVYVTTNLGLTVGHICGIVIVAIVLLGLFMFGGYTWWKRCKQAKKWYNSGVKVQVPEEQKDWDHTTELGSDSVSSETPFLPTMYHQEGDPYNRSISINSMDSGLSLDDAINPEDMYSYVRTGYISSPTPLRSIPEDADIDEVFRSGIDPRGRDTFVQTYKVNTPGAAHDTQNGYLANSTGSSQPQVHDQSRSGISKYASVAIDGHSDMEPPEKYNCVAFSTGLNEVRLGSDERMPSPDSTCTYTQIQTDLKNTKRMQNPFTKAFWNANHSKMNNHTPGCHTNQGPTLDPAKSRRMPRSGKHRNLDGSFKRKAPHGYVANDGTFEPSVVSRVSTDYVANDGTFDPSKASTVPTDYVTNDGSFDPSNSSKVVTEYVANDGTFDPSKASRLSTDYVANDGSFDPANASEVLTDCVISDRRYNHSNASKTCTDYVPNDGTFDPSKVSKLPTDYVANDGSFDPASASEISTDYVANDIIFEPSTASMASTGYVPNDGTFDPSSGCHSKRSTESGTTSLDAHNSGNCQSGKDAADSNSSLCRANELNHGVNSGAVLLENNTSGYVPHSVAFVLGSMDSLNHRLSAVDADHADGDCFDLMEPKGTAMDDHSQADHEQHGTPEAMNSEATIRSHNESDLSSPHQGCRMQTSHDCQPPQVCHSGIAPSEHGGRLQLRPGRMSQFLSSPLEPIAYMTSSPEHRMSSPGYVNIEPDSCHTVSCNIPTTLASVSRQCGGFVKEVKPTISHPLKTAVEQSLNSQTLAESHHHEQNDSANSEQLEDTSDALHVDNLEHSSSHAGGIHSRKPPEGIVSHDRSNVENNNLASTLKQNGILTCLSNGYVKPCPALDSVNSVSNGVTVCGSSCANDARSFGDRDAASSSENNNIMKVDFCRPSTIVKVAEAGVPLV